MCQLNDKQQNILSLRYESRLTIPEISEVLKMKEGTIKSHIHRATKKLRVLMNESLEQKAEERYAASPANQTRRALGASRL
jgi:DNA-directed RNA polymerase specialized sigma24 family protein